MKMKKTGYIVSLFLYIASAYISHIYKFGTKNTYWSLLNVFVIIIPSFLQTIINLKNNKNSNNIIVMYIILGVFIILFLTGILILTLLLFKIIDAPLY